MSEFTAEEVRAEEQNVLTYSSLHPGAESEWKRNAEMLRAYADSIERAEMGVTKEVEERAYKAFCRAGNRVTRGTEQDCLRAALLAVWPSVAAQPEPASASADAEDAARIKALINTPEIEHFLRAVHIEAVHQVERWGTAHDRAKRPADWFWLVGYLAGKALHAATSDNRDKALHHCVSTAAALYNWHCAINGTDVRMCPGRSDLAELVDCQFPGEAPTADAARAARGGES